MAQGKTDGNLGMTKLINNGLQAEFAKHEIIRGDLEGLNTLSEKRIIQEISVFCKKKIVGIGKINRIL